MTLRSLLIVLALTGTVVAGYYVDALWHSDSEPPPAVSAPAPPAAEALLRELAADGALDPRVLQALEQLHAAQQRLAREQRQLRAELAELNAGAEFFAGELSGDADDEEPEPGLTEQDRTAAASRRPSRGRVTQERLVAAGFLPYQAEEIVSTADRLAMERLNLQYQAQREGWLRTERYGEALREIPAIREVLTRDYGETGYDRYLYASGRPNRIIVNDVYRESPASGAGLMSGDQVIAMDGRRVYSERDMRQVASEGSAGENIALVVERDGTQFEVYVPRGPLGVRTGRGYVAPDDG